jgi:hypothetical protein
MDAWAVLRRRFVTRNFMAGAASRSQRRPRPDRSDLHAEMLENRVLLSAWVVTDKPDYAPGQTAVIDAGGFAVGETVALQVVHHDGAHGDDGAHQPWFVTDGGTGDLDGLADGDIHTSWYVGTGERGASLDLAATGLTSGEVATTHFTDVSPLDSVDVSAQSGTLTYGTGGDATYTVTVNRDLAFVGAFDVVLDVTAGLPSGATFSFEVGGVPTNELNFTASDDSLSATLIVSTSNDSPAGSFLFDVSAEVTSGGVPTGDFVTNTGTLVIGKLALTGTITAADKAYDGTTSATIVDRDLTGVVSGDDVQYVGGTASFDTKNVGTGKTVTATGMTLTGADAGNYTVNSTATTTANVTALAITGSITAADKTYDGTTVATITTRTLSGAIAGDAVSYSGGTATFADKNAGAGKTVTAIGLALSGADAGNYTVNATATTTANINQATLTVTADNKSINVGNALPTLTASFSGFVAGETLATSGVTGSPALTTTATASSPAGTYPINAALGTLAAGNYTFAFVDGTLTIVAVTTTSTLTVPSKVRYGQDATFTVTLTPAQSNGQQAATGVQFYLDGKAIGTVQTLTQNGDVLSASLTIVVVASKGNHTVTAKFIGVNSSFQVSDPAAQTMNVSNHRHHCWHWNWHWHRHHRHHRWRN